MNNTRTRVSHVSIWEKTILDREKNRYKGPEVGGVCLVCSKNRREASGVGAGGWREGKGDKVKE